MNSKNTSLPAVFLVKKSFSWLERKVRDPAGARQGGSPTARGKRVPGAEINIQIV
ncbi:hypothetical protein J7J00_01035 [Bacillus sp. ISL-4]|uniref:hypothetical protein n=1 Tax=Bacillus sp. ISL-4 TaxID=2819125 RepID=UPI001BE599DA|nr:hypothetical protein [Bacillus sp. ISL-4]MBT2664093.1 hypothetical protein [Bacillus sp. ISL-4]